jgi:hypothetical protein
MNSWNYLTEIKEIRKRNKKLTPAAGSNLASGSILPGLVAHRPGATRTWRSACRSSGGLLDPASPATRGGARPPTGRGDGLGEPILRVTGHSRHREGASDGDRLCGGVGGGAELLRWTRCRGLGSPMLVGRFAGGKEG